MWGKFIRSTARGHVIGIVSTDTGIYAALYQQSRACYRVFASADWPSVAKWAYTQLGRRVPLRLRVVLDFEQYQLFQVQRPDTDIPQSDWRQVLALAVRDRLEYPLTECQIDYFPLPADARGANERVNVVTAHKLLLKKMVNGILEADMDVDSISVPELELRHLFGRYISGDLNTGVCFVAPRGGQRLSLFLYRNNALYMTRTLAGMRAWDEYLMPEDLDVRESLLLEMQRTLDYYQTQLQQPPVKLVLVPDWGGMTDDLAGYLAANLGIDVRVIASPEAGTEHAEPKDRRALTLADAAVCAQGGTHG